MPAKERCGIFLSEVEKSADKSEACYQSLARGGLREMCMKVELVNVPPWQSIEAQMKRMTRLRSCVNNPGPVRN